jgi:hypothetical protein
MIDREPERRARHWIVAAEGDESLARAQRNVQRPIGIAEQIYARDHDLVRIGMRMAAVVEALAPVPDSQHAIRNRQAFEIECSVED